LTIYATPTVSKPEFAPYAKGALKAMATNLDEVLKKPKVWSKRIILDILFD